MNFINPSLLKSYNYEKNVETSPTDEEIKKHNMTAIKDDTGIVFNYYWKIDHIKNYLNKNEYLQSADFHFSGKQQIITIFHTTYQFFNFTYNECD